MKKLQESTPSFVAMLALVVLLLAPSCCKDKSCKNGGILDKSDCDCDCPCYYTGEKCNDEKTPTRIDIDKVVVTRFPATNGTAGWDVAVGEVLADLTITLHKECSPGPGVPSSRPQITG